MHLSSSEAVHMRKAYRLKLSDQTVANKISLSKSIRDVKIVYIKVMHASQSMRHLQLTLPPPPQLLPPTLSVNAGTALGRSSYDRKAIFSAPIVTIHSERWRFFSPWGPRWLSWVAICPAYHSVVAIFWWLLFCSPGRFG